MTNLRSVAQSTAEINAFKQTEISINSKLWNFIKAVTPAFFNTLNTVN